MGSRKKVRVSLNRITGAGGAGLVSNVILSSLPGNLLSAGPTAPLGLGTGGTLGRDLRAGPSRTGWLVGKSSVGRAGAASGKDDTGTGTAAQSWGTRS